VNAVSIRMEAPGGTGGATAVGVRTDAYVDADSHRPYLKTGNTANE